MVITIKFVIKHVFAKNTRKCLFSQAYIQTYFVIGSTSCDSMSIRKKYFPLFTLIEILISKIVPWLDDRYFCQYTYAMPTKISKNRDLMFIHIVIPTKYLKSHLGFDLKLHSGMRDLLQQIYYLSPNIICCRSAVK